MSERIATASLTHPPAVQALSTPAPLRPSFSPSVVQLLEVLARIEQRRQLRLLSERMREVS